MPDETANSNELALCIINDGDGSQCGRSYKARCNTARYRASLQAVIWAEIARNMADWYDLNQDDAGKIFTTRDILLAALEVADYYAEHVKELA